MKRKNRGWLRRLFWSLFLVLGVMGSMGIWRAYDLLFRPAIELHDDNGYFYIPTGSDLDRVANDLKDGGYIREPATFKWVAEKKNYHKHIHPGRYRLREGMSINALINLFRSGKQEPVRLTFNNVRTAAELASKLSRDLECDSADLYHAITDPQTAAHLGFNAQNFMTMFIPNTYEFWWNTSIAQLLDRMAMEYKKFWNKSRQAEAKKIGLSQSETTILASIVVSEQHRHSDEWPRIAGLYLNRLKKKMPLQSDPTIVFAKGDFSIRRVLDEDKQIDSPYNTYKNKGLPPGPICLPSPSAIDAVLNCEDNDYLYMCARTDGSGYHVFAKTLAQHQLNAAAYHRMLNSRKTYR